MKDLNMMAHVALASIIQGAVGALGRFYGVYVPYHPHGRVIERTSQMDNHTGVIIMCPKLHVTVAIHVIVYGTQCVPMVPPKQLKLPFHPTPG